MYSKGSTLIESLFAFEIYCTIIILFLSLYNQLAVRVADNATEYHTYIEERYEREKDICLDELSDIQKLLP
ncbi:hypothetical protein [Tannockella kyphosi]|uniref:hypothetical protein n=1 Tax=Tannockella kyphosi TaxID=2899121 RepID=UPI00201264CD|nr:hypothetical protein [Tannockella kyphosi]